MAQHTAPVVIGTRKNGRPIYLIQGGSETTEDTTTGVTTTETADLSWDSLRAAWEQGGLNPAQVQGRLEASRKWEQRAKSAPSGDELATLKEKAARADALANDLATDTERAANEARAAATTEAANVYKPLLVETAFTIAVGDRKTADEVKDFIADLNLSRFLTEDGKVDTAKVLARVNEFAPATGSQQQQTGRKGPTATVHGSGSGTTSTTAASGRDLWEQQHGRRPGATTTAATS